MRPTDPQTLTVQLGPRSYSVTVAPSDESAWVTPLRTHVDGRRVAVVTDENVVTHYNERLTTALVSAGTTRLDTYVVPAGEASKTAGQLNRLYEQLLNDRFGRDGVICALGGGVVGDLAGYVAATIHRGVDLIQLPTTVLAMVDSAIGGKTGINHPAGKNLIGAFKQPIAVSANLDTLLTLPERERMSGLAEVIKYGVISDSALFSRLGGEARTLCSASPAQLLDIILASARIKVDVVSRDEQESGLRMILNFGHTLGHAIERTAGYGTWLHGEAVAVGMVLAGEFGETRGITRPGVAARIAEVCRAVGLPTAISPDQRVSLAGSIGSDKKVRGKYVHFVFAQQIGTVVVEPVEVQALTAWLEGRGAVS